MRNKTGRNLFPIGNKKWEWEQPVLPGMEHFNVGEMIVKKTEKAKKYDAGKAPFSLLPYGPLEEIAKVLDFGAAKYGTHNWLGGMSWSRLADACLRHVFARIWGEKLDPETGLSHFAHAACCLLFLLQYEQKNLGTDDFYKCLIVVEKEKENET